MRATTVTGLAWTAAVSRDVGSLPQIMCTYPSAAVPNARRGQIGGAESCVQQEFRRVLVTGLLSYSSLEDLEATAAIYITPLPSPHRDA